ncbi:MAG TPA: TonB-dependent receptor plug domain-containing protein [Burkholderiaceae bacterium]|nr:TonB-dependent receptor plug domain-containing protein [Burkholderiaceae bacterium]
MNHPAVWRCLVATLMPSFIAGQAVAASDDICELDIPAGPLERSLLEIARSCNVIASFRPDVIEGRTAPAISGRYTVRQAFTLAVQPSNLVVDTTSGGSVTVRPGPVPADKPVAATPAPAPADTASMGHLPPVVVTGSPQGSGLRAARGWSATRTDTPLSELPQAVSVLTSESLDLQGGRSATDSAYFVPGLTVSNVVSGSVEDFGRTGVSVPSLTVRGMPAAYALSGQRMLRDAVVPDNFFLERIEVPKGPSGTVDGLADWKGRGGLVNMVLKEPGAGSFTSLSQSVSSRDSGTVRLNADVSRSVNDRAAWRMLGFVEHSGRTEGGYEKQAAAGLLGAGSLRLGDFSGALTLRSERRRDAPAPAARGGRTLVDGTLVDLPPTRETQLPADPTDRHLFTSSSAHLNLRWNLSPRWSVTSSTMAEAFQSDLQRHQSFTFPENDRANQSSGVSTQWGLVGDITDGQINHRFLLALDASHWRSATSGVDFVDGKGPLRIDVYESKAGVLLQDELSVGALRLRLAVQQARTPTHRETIRDNKTGEERSSLAYLPESSLNWDAGMLYQIRPTVAIYAGGQQATEASLVLPGQTNGGAPIKPSPARQLQAGLKLSTPDRRLSATFEAFRITQSGFKLFKDGGLVVEGRSSDGLEFELTGRPVPRVDLALGFSYLNTVDRTLTANGLVDTMANQIPRRSAYLLSRIRLGDWVGQDNRLGVSFRAASTTLIGVPYFPAAATLPRGLPGGAQLDLSWQGMFGNWTVKGAMANVFDQRLFGTAGDTRYIPLQPGRSISLTGTYFSN